MEGQSKAIRARRAQQDFTRLDGFLTASDWSRLRESQSNRDRLAFLCNVLHQRLELRLPTEQTYAAIVSVVACVEQGQAPLGTSAWTLHLLLQEAKTTWRNTCQRYKKWQPEPEALLESLPVRFQDLPDSIRSKYGAEQPATEETRGCSAEAVIACAGQVRLRQSHHEHLNNTAQRPLGMGMGVAAAQWLEHMSAQASAVSMLSNLQIFPENLRGRQSSSHTAQPAAPSTGGMAEPTQRPKMPEGRLKALTDSPWHEMMQAGQCEKGVCKDTEQEERKLVAALTGGESSKDAAQKATDNAEALEAHRQAAREKPDEDSKDLSRPMKRPKHIVYLATSKKIVQDVPRLTDRYQVFSMLFFDFLQFRIQVLPELLGAGPSFRLLSTPVLARAPSASSWARLRAPHGRKRPPQGRR